MIKVYNRFIDKFVKVESGCWDWQTGKNNWGYGKFSIKGKFIAAHRFSYMYYNDRFDLRNKPKICILHKCDNPACVNPSHLFEGSNSDNMRDKVNKGRHHSQLKTHCKNGHEFSLDNTKVNNKSHRHCRTCRKEASQRLRDKKKAVMFE